jgi:hypothetical protein
MESLLLAYMMCAKGEVGGVCSRNLRGPLLPIRKVLGFLMLVRNEDEDEDEERYRNRAGSA